MGIGIVTTLAGGLLPALIASFEQEYRGVFLLLFGSKDSNPIVRTNYFARNAIKVPLRQYGYGGAGDRFADGVTAGEEC